MYMMVKKKEGPSRHLRLLFVDPVDIGLYVRKETREGAIRGGTLNEVTGT